MMLKNDTQERSSGCRIPAVRMLWEHVDWVQFPAPRHYGCIEPPFFLWYTIIMNQLHTKAIQLRKEGYSYALINKRLGVSKSTLSNWLTEIPFKPNQEVLNRINNTKLKLVRTKQKDKFETWARIKKEARIEVGRLTKRDLFMFGLGLYLGEGAKAYDATQIINANPDIIRLALKWFSEICGVPRENFSITIHLYPDTNVNETLKFWQKQTGIPRRNFWKTQLDKREGKSKTKRNKLPYGTASITVRALGNPIFGVQLHRRILAWMDHAMDNTRV